MNEKYQTEQTLSSVLSNKCEIICDMEERTNTLEQLNEQLKQEMERLAIENEQKIRELTDKLTEKYLEEHRQLNEQHTLQLTQKTQNFEAEIATLNALLLKKAEDFEELAKRSRIESEDLMESSKLAAEKALQDQKLMFEEMIDKVKKIICGIFL